MEKLLHERLRELETNECCMICQIVGLDKCPSISCEKCELHMFNALADEIERYYIPRPRFEDGEPVQFGDKFLRWDGKNGNDGENVTEIAVQSGDHYRWSINGDCCTSQLVARPTHRVYDADGVEIKVGEKLYNPNGDIFEVRSIEGDEDEWLLWCGETKCGIKVCYRADECAHERPVFDAEGERICKGDTVWHVKGSNPWKVIDVSNKGIKVEDPLCSHDTEVFDASSLTHREPDSLEKLRDDMKRNNIDPIPMEINAWVDRLTALIERGA